jgi:hypothetical protein
MITLELDEETKKYLNGILTSEDITIEELFKSLLRDRYQATQPTKSILQRLEDIGSLPGELPNSPSNLSDRDVRNQVISEYLQKRYDRSQGEYVHGEV